MITYSSPVLPKVFNLLNKSFLLNPTDNKKFAILSKSSVSDQKKTLRNILAKLSLNPV